MILINIEKLLIYLEKLIEEGKDFITKYPDLINYMHHNDQVKEFRNKFDQWQHISREAVKKGLSHINGENFEKDRLYTDVLNASTFPSVFFMEGESTCKIHSPVNQILNSLKSLKQNIESTIEFTIDDTDEENLETNNSEIKVLSRICDKFTTVSKELIDYRYGNGKRSTITMNDEYDVQDLFRSLLHLHFDEVIPEEYSASYAGGKSRIDFNLPNEKIIIEIKLASKTIGDKKIGEQLAIDYTRYQGKDNWEHLFCFVYDPNKNIRYAKTLKKQLETAHPKMTVVISN